MTWALNWTIPSVLTPCSKRLFSGSSCEMCNHKRSDRNCKYDTTQSVSCFFGTFFYLKRHTCIWHRLITFQYMYIIIYLHDLSIVFNISTVDLNLTVARKGHRMEVKYTYWIYRDFVIKNRKKILKKSDKMSKFPDNKSQCQEISHFLVLSLSMSLVQRMVYIL